MKRAAFLALLMLIGCSSPERRVIRYLPQTVAQPNPYRVEVQRTFSDSLQATLLRIAESVYPSRDSVLASVPETERELADSIASAPRAWWNSTFDGVKIPYAITVDAVHYYLDLSDAFRRGDFRESHGLRMDETSFTYTAKIEPAEHFEAEGREYTSVYIARLELSWSQHCGLLCALAVDAERTVVLDSAGTVLAVFGDGEVSVVVS